MMKKRLIPIVVATFVSLAIFVISGCNATEIADTEKKKNSIEYLFNHWEQLDSVALIDKKTMTLTSVPDQSVIDSIRQALRMKKKLEGFTLTSPPWDFFVRLQLKDGTSFYMHMASPHSLRYNPYNELDKAVNHQRGKEYKDVMELYIGEELFSYISKNLNIPIHKEYQMSPEMKNGLKSLQVD